MSEKRVGYYDQNWQEYDGWYNSHPAIYQSELNVLKKIIPSGVGLEIGVGTGRFASLLSSRFGLDPSFHMLKLAKERGIEVVQGFGEELPFKNDTFNFVIIVFTIEFADDPLRFLEEATRTLKKRGALILGILDKKSSWGKYYKRKQVQSKYYKDFRYFSPEEILQLFKNIPVEFKAAFQTLLQPPPDIKNTEKPVKGFGRGGFVVLKAIKE
ncbi:MAG: class I SAM-dependent methyltransferase [Candidatus Aminicenantes bacterium]|jgi:ubiquinone/menaquinone biosynthesis C-methylase UbiE|nr:class I SAM-dependent methyltransferase [Candidatus Aminicenantes bacterium]